MAARIRAIQTPSRGRNDQYTDRPSAVAKIAGLPRRVPINARRAVQHACFRRALRNVVERLRRTLTTKAGALPSLRSVGAGGTWSSREHPGSFRTDLRTDAGRSRFPDRSRALDSATPRRRRRLDRSANRAPALPTKRGESTQARTQPFSSVVPTMRRSIAP